MVCRPADRLSQLCLALQLFPQAFAIRMELSLHRANRVLRPSRGPTHKLMARVLRAFPEVNPTWLLCGDEDILLPPTPPPGGNYVHTNYGTCIQLIQPCICGCKQTEPPTPPLTKRRTWISLM